MVKLKNPLVWLHGLVGTFIGGGAGAVGSGIAGILTDPTKFNIQEPAALLKLMAITFLFTGLSGAMTYLAKSPLPPITEEDTMLITKPKE